MTALSPSSSLHAAKIATAESWKDKSSGERRSITQWHKVVIFNEGIVSIAEKYLKKGAKVYVEGQLETRKWTDQSGQEKYVTEVVLRPFRGELTMLEGSQKSEAQSNKPPEREIVADFEDEIPF